MAVPLACLQAGKLNYNYMKKMNSLLICVSRNPGCELIGRAESGGAGKDVVLEVNTIISPPVRERSTSGRLAKQEPWFFASWSEASIPWNFQHLCNAAHLTARSGGSARTGPFPRRRSHKCRMAGWEPPHLFNPQSTKHHCLLVCPSSNFQSFYE